MDNNAILSAIDEQIERLQAARRLLTDVPVTSEKRGRGRPKKTAIVVAPVKKRVLSPEAKARIAAAQKKRWAAQRTVAVKTPAKTVAKKTAVKTPPKKTVPKKTETADTAKE